jgi:hypothetical protein
MLNLLLRPVLIVYLAQLVRGLDRERPEPALGLLDENLRENHPWTVEDAGSRVKIIRKETFA